MELREHNIETYKQVKEQLGLYGRSIVVQPTGTGKSYIMMKMLKENEDSYKVVVGSSINVLRELQLKKEWIHKGTFCYTYNNLDKLICDLKSYDIDVKLICLDEVHRAGAKVWGKYVNELLELCPNAMILGLTATPVRFLDSKRDMVKEIFNGVSAGNLTIQQCVERGILPQATYVVGMLDIRTNIEERLKAIRKSKKSSDDKEQANNILQEYKENWDRDANIINTLSEKIGEFTDKNYKHIVFVPSIEVADNMESVIKYWFTQVYKQNNVNIYKVHSKLKNANSIMEEFCNVNNNTDIDVLICVNMANEGFHVENTKSVIMLRYTNSPNLYLQQIGRALASGGESPYIFDFIGNIDAISNILDIIENNEVKVSNILTDNTFEKFKVNSKKLFKTFEDNTDSFRKAIKKVDRIIANKWDSYFSEIEELGEEFRNKPELLKWFKQEQKKFLDNQLSTEKEQKFITLGNKVYMTDTLRGYDKDIIDEIEKFRYTGSITSKIEKVRYLAFIDKLPKEVEKYIRDNNIELGINEDWFKQKCMEYNEQVYNKFMNLLNTIEKFNIDGISSRDKIVEYESIVNSLIVFLDIFNKHNGSMNNREDLLYNMLGKYWKIQRSKMASHIEIDIGTLKTHAMLIQEFKGCIEKEQKDWLMNNVYNIPEQLRSRSTNKIIQIISNITSV